MVQFLPLDLDRRLGKKKVVRIIDFFVIIQISNIGFLLSAHNFNANNYKVWTFLNASRHETLTPVNWADFKRWKQTGND